MCAEEKATMANEKDNKKKEIEYDDDYDVWYDDRGYDDVPNRYADIPLKVKEETAKELGITLEELLSFDTM